MIAIFIAFKHFILESRHFNIFADHKPREYALPNSTDKYTSRNIRYEDLISQNILDIYLDVTLC